ncbi:ATP-binding cassette domain-containing protein, partial [Nocardia farcinica]|uniref:ATP-binding cassette domain-containing protein n=1 Tax=Nocardia farcinica TaxID=37329 RepID=UPI00245544E0
MTRVAEPLIEVRGLGAHAGAATILDDIGFALPAGRIVTLFGPSGAGKTTIAAAVAGVRQPGVQLTGDIRHHGEIRVGYLPQNAAATLNPARRVGAAQRHNGGVVGACWGWAPGWGGLGGSTAVRMAMSGTRLPATGSAVSAST